MIRWQDTESVYIAVSTALDKLERDRTRGTWAAHWEDCGWSFEEQRWTKQRSTEEIVRGLEEIAVADAKAGDPTWLFRWFLSPDRPEYRAHVSRETWALILDCAMHESPFLKKRKPGPRPMSDDARRTRYPIHAAAALVPEIEKVLSELFRGRPAAEIKERAQQCAERRTSLEPGAVGAHQNRPKSRQIPPR